jgi:hypothetical protein
MFTVSTNEGKTTAFTDGSPVQSYQNTPATKSRSARKPRPGNPNYFIGPKLKVERAKRHIQELETAVKAFHNSNPYDFPGQEDPHTREYVYRVTVKKPIPIEISAVIGDIVHNLRCVLDYLVCDCIRAANRMPGGNSGLPVKREAKRLKPGSVPKIEGVSPRAERFFLRLKGRKGVNEALWKMHMLDIIDKHNAIVTVGAAIIQVTAKVGVPGMFLTAQGTIAVLGGGPGGQPLMIDAGTPDTFFRVFPLNNNVEVYRGPAGFNEELKIATQIAFGQGQVAEGETVLETLIQLTDFVERVIGVCERQCL